jgi:hypothetical protein
MNQNELSTQKESTGQVVLKVLLIIAGVALILVLGIWIGRTMAGDTLPEGPEIVPPPPPADGPYVVANAYINVRSGPGTEFPAYGVAPPGSSAELIGVSEDEQWWISRVPTSVSPDGTAWVFVEYVTAYNTDQLPVPEPLE